MQNHKLALLGLTLLLAALAADHALGRLVFNNPPRLPVESFPRAIGEWKAGPDQPVDPSIREKLPTATIVDRVYQNGFGQPVELTLVSAQDYNDLHDQRLCLPAQGWQISDPKLVAIAGRQINFVSAARNDEKIEMLFWLAGKNLRDDTLPERLRSLRTTVAGVQGYSLLVRLTATGDEDGHRALFAFAHAMLPPLAKLEAQALQRR
ncbi:MAG TPA: exosortase-associated EpsI family protein [Chthonomonadaceae bacterium]|nr:exosortase-associated EpsI family protein [Chthonomonadaceae bacterium]